MSGDETAVQVLVEFKKDLFSRFDVPSWNLFVQELLDKGVLAATWRPGERPPSLVVFLDFTGIRMANRHLDGVNLSLCRLDEGSFEHASLRDAILGFGRNVNYRGARLDGADFEYSDISGCDFTGASGIETAVFRRASYFVGNPPVGLPPQILAKCDPSAEPPPTDRRDRPNAHTRSDGGESPLRCVATICSTPIPTET